MSIRFRYSKLTYSDLVDSMGLTETPIINPPAPGPQWPVKAFITMGNRCHGDALSPDFVNLIKSVYGTPPTGNGAWLIANQWARPVPWARIVVGANNRCTNAAVMVFDTQMQYFSISQQKWILISTPQDKSKLWTSSYFNSNYTTTIGTADYIFKSKFNMPAYNPVILSANRTTEDTLPPTSGKYGILYSSLLGGNSVVFNTLDIGGIFVSCSMRLISSDGNPFNSSSIEIMGQVGADYWPEIDKKQNEGYLTGIFQTPAVGCGSFRLLPTDGSIKKLYFITADINPNTFIQNLSDYVIANGLKSQCMTATKLQNNLPQLMAF